MRMRAAIVFLLLSATTVAVVPQQGTGAISGILVNDEADPKPIRRARVTLTEDAGAGWTTVSDDTGTFRFAALPAGRFTLRASKEGFVPATYGARRPGGSGTAISLTGGQQATGLTMRLLRGAVVTGTVRDERGRLVPNVGVSLMRWEIKAGSRWLAAYGSERATDDRGIYRIYGLPPGDYLIRAGSGVALTSGAKLLTAADIQRVRAAAASGRPIVAATTAPAQPPPPLRAYAPVFYPGATDPMNGTWITLTAGEERAGLDVAISLVASAKIAGTVTSPVSGLSVTATSVILMPASQQVLSDGIIPAHMARPDESGRFGFSGVTPGSYTLTAQLAVLTNRAPAPPATPTGGRGGGPAPDTENFFATATVLVSGADVGVALTLRPGAKIAGRLLFDGSSPRPSSFSAFRFGLRSIDSIPVPSLPFFQPDGTFRVAGVAPGRHVLIWSPPADSPWWIVSATAGGKDVLDAPLDVGAGDEISDFTITLGDTPTEFTGLLQDASGRPAADYFIVIFARDKARWTPESRWVTAIRPGTDGRFAVKGLPPGDYLVAALTDVQQGEWFLPDFLSSLVPAAAPVKLSTGQKTVQDLQIR